MRQVERRQLRRQAERRQEDGDRKETETARGRDRKEAEIKETETESKTKKETAKEAGSATACLSFNSEPAHLLQLLQRALVSAEQM